MTSERYRRRLQTHVSEGRLVAALGVIALWREKEPASLEVELMHAHIDLLLGKYRQANDRALASVESLNCPPELALDAAHCLRSFEAHDALIRWASGYPHRAKMNAHDESKVAALISSTGAQSLALDWIEGAIIKSPDDSFCRINRALILIYLGQMDRARVDLNIVIDSANDVAMAHWLLSRLERQTLAVNHIDRLRERIANWDFDVLDQGFLQYALFKELDDLGERDAAWEALEKACQLMREHAPHHRVAQERLFAAIQRTFPCCSPSAQVAANAVVPIFIVGMHRSGTTLLERMLGTHADVFDYGESNRLTSALRYAADCAGEGVVDEALVSRAETMDFSVACERFLGEGKSRFGDARFVTEKNPANFQLIGFIRQALPHAKIIHLRREPMDLCFANLRELFANSVSYSYSLEDLAHLHGLYERLMQHWRESYPGFVLDVDYEALVSDPLATSRRVFEFCGLEWSPDVVDPKHSSARPVSTLSAMQVRQPIATTSVGRWKSYAKQLAPLRAALGLDP